ncbi:hypothetical protein GCM10022239_14530 [Leifsonia bigeumensis]|uniref:DUF4307 domain-containing protein n=1 Tax=Leifsonella bigeumensis TaxID=433643 RepID=A0ABP7FHI1_9MICO
MADATPERTRAALDARYGRTADRSRRDRWIIVVAAVLFAAIFTAWVVWAGLDNGQGGLDARDIGHRLVDDRTVSVTWEVSVTAGTEVSCALQAQNEAHGIVGWKIVDLPASETYTRQYTETVRTAQRAVTGLIYRCWLT